MLVIIIRIDIYALRTEGRGWRCAGEYVTGDVTPEYLRDLEESARVAKRDRTGAEKTIDLCGARST